MARRFRSFGSTPAPPLPLALQSARLVRSFPSFRFLPSQKAWRGELHPRDDSPFYRVLVRWRGIHAPKVWVEFPDLHPEAPHLYPDHSLCLFFPADQSWTPRHHIADTILTWTAQWLFFYESWIEFGEWFGPEAPHPVSGSK